MNKIRYLLFAAVCLGSLLLLLVAHGPSLVPAPGPKLQLLPPPAPTPTNRPLKLRIVGWHDELVSPLSGAGKSLAKLGYAVSTTSGLHRTWAELYDRLHDADVVLWWYWGPPIGELVALRRQLPDQVWAVFNWDDPHTVFTDADRMRDRAALWDLVFTSGESTIPYYQSRGAVREAVFLPPPADVDVFYPDPPADNQTGVVDAFDCDVNFVLTNLYAQFDPFPSTVNRTGLILAVADAAEREGFRFHLYGPQGINIAPAHYKGAIDYEAQRQLFARCRITINTHVNSGFGGRYANERDVIAPASGGLLLVDGVTPSILEHGRDCLMMAATDPEQIAQQVVQILRDYDTYLHVRQQAVRTVRQKYTADAWAGTVDAGIRRFMHSR